MTKPHPKLIAMAKANYERRQQIAWECGIKPTLWDDAGPSVQAMERDCARAALTALREPTADMVEAGQIAALVTLAEHGIPTDVQELLVGGDGRGTIAPHALRKALAASVAAMLAPVLGNPSQGEG